MADDTQVKGTGDRRLVAKEQPYEVAYFARKHGLTRARARALIDEIGNDREKLDAAAAAETAGASSPPVRPRAPRRRAASKATSPRGSTTASPNPTTRRTASRRNTTTGNEPADVARAAIGAPAGAARAVTKSVGDRVETATRQAGAAAAKLADQARQTTRRAGRGMIEAPAAVRRQARRAIAASDTSALGRNAALVGAAAAGLITGLAVTLGRKAVAQAPSVFAGDWLEALKVEHRAAFALIDALDRTNASARAKRERLLSQLKRALDKHAFTEENAIYPALREWGDKADADKLHHDHGYVKQYLYELDAIGVQSTDFAKTLYALRSELEAHVREEEDLIFPKLHAALGDDKNRSITALANKQAFKVA